MHLSPRDEKGRVDVVGTALFFFYFRKRKRPWKSGSSTAFHAYFTRVSGGQIPPCGSATTSSFHDSWIGSSLHPLK